MRYRRLGRTGLQVSEVGVGGAPLGIEDYLEKWSPDTAESERSVRDMLSRAIGLGYNYIDTAPSYGAGRSEELIGLGLDGGLRSKTCLATKFLWRGQDKAAVMESVEASLRRLRTDYVDVLQIHGDTGYAYTPEDFRWIMESGPMEAMQQLREQGKVRYLGITCEEPVSLVPFLETDQFDMIQIKYNVIHQGAWHNVIPLAAKLDVGVVVMRPLTSGIFQKLMRNARPDIEELVDLNELALNFILSEPAIASAIVGARRPSEVERNNAISDAARRIDLGELQDRRVRG
ncbi:aldo/keto reductase [Arthrobacter sp. 92]|uniref:aldo/keto reductase n=1 Tax=Arthrobacter sp. 92 TaxID=3418175 RepID=UPI003D06DF13